jgi:SNF2 family DNA or RNA helicase
VKSYGTIKHDRGKWVLDVEPHVVIRLKRLFPRLAKNVRGTIRLTDTVEVCRELDWFMERYPLSWPKLDDRELLSGRSQQHRETETLVAQLMAGQRTPRDFELALPARDYQRVAAELALATHGLLIADDMGLGKTCEAICVLSDARTRPGIVVTLPHLQRQWEAEFRKFAPYLSTHIVKKSEPYDVRLGSSRARAGQIALLDDAAMKTPDVLIMTYHKLAGWVETLSKVAKSVIWDEAQEVRRGEKSKKGTAAMQLARAVDYRVGITGTPIYNYGSEFHPVLEVIRPGALGSLNEFLVEWCSGWDKDKAKVKDPKAFGSYIRDACLMIRRTKADVGRELPDLIKIPHVIDCDESAIKRVESSAMNLARVILAHNEEVRGAKWKASEELSNMVRQATGVAKAPYVADFVRMIVDSGENIVLFGWHREFYSIVHERLADLNPAMYTGSESESQKEESKRRFLSGETKVLIMSLRSGAGIDGLQDNGRVVVFGELDWAYGVHEQCTARRWRDGQKDPVLAYYLMSEMGSDPIIADVLGVKRGQLEGVRDPEGGFIEKLETSGDHIRRLAEAYLAKREAA